MDETRVDPLIPVKSPVLAIAVYSFCQAQLELELLPGFLQLGLERIINKNVARRDHRRVPPLNEYSLMRTPHSRYKGQDGYFILIRGVQVNDHLVRSGKFTAASPDALKASHIPASP